MNVAAQNVALGDLLDSLLENGGSGGGTGDVSLVDKGSYLEFPTIGVEGNLYIDTSANTLYRWDDKDLKYYMIGSSIETIYDTLEFIDGGNANG
jgi:hypothetical protein